MAKLDFDLARTDRSGADHVVAHFVATEQVAKIFLVQGGQRLRQVACTGAARQVAVVVYLFLRQRHMRKAADSMAATVFARAALEQVAQQRLA